MSITLEQLSARMRQGEQVPLRHTAQVALTLSIPSILQQIVVTAMEYIDAAMVGHIGAAATASIGIVSSSTWLLHGMLAGLCMAFSIQVAQYLGADRQQDARGVLRQSMLFNLAVGLAAAAFGVGISRFLPGWLGADAALRANASAYFAIWSASCLLSWLWAPTPPCCALRVMRLPRVSSASLPAYWTSSSTFSSSTPPGR